MVDYTIELYYTILLYYSIIILLVDYTIAL